MRSVVADFDGTYRRMNQQTKIDIRHSTCPHDCPSACALDVEVIDGSTVGRVRGSKLQSYTAGVVCAKVARYAERIHHAERLVHPLRRTGPKGSGQFARISWDEALDEIADRFNAAEREFGAESVWPYYYAGTMGLVMRDGINRLAHVKKYSRFYSTICANVARVGFAIGTGKIAGVDPREMGPAPTAPLPAASCMSCSAKATPTGRIWNAIPIALASSRRTLRPARRNGLLPFAACR